MAPRKTPNVSKPATRPSPIDPIEAEAKKLIAELKKRKAELSTEESKLIRLTKKHETNKEELERKISETKSDMEKKREKHSKKMTKMREETAKAEEMSKNAERLAVGAEPNNVEKLKRAEISLQTHRQKCLDITKKILSADVTANGGEPLSWQYCEICVLPFDKQLHIPKTLECGHTICNNCIDNFPVTERVFSRFFNCPFDRRVIQIPIWSRRVERNNLAVLDLCD
ncbi:unnamed protein product [Caenorhabditis brenneri]